MWVIFGIFAILSLIFLSGHGVKLIAGYSSLNEEEKASLDEKKLCHIVGIGMLVIALLFLIWAIFIDVLPLWFVYLALVIIIVDCAVIIVLGNKKK